MTKRQKFRKVQIISFALMHHQEAVLITKFNNPTNQFWTSRSFEKFSVLYGVDYERKVYYISDLGNKTYLDKGMFYDEDLKKTTRHSKLRLECNVNFKENIKNTDSNDINPFFTHEVHFKDDKILNCIKMLCESGQQYIL